MSNEITPTQYQEMAGRTECDQTRAIARIANLSFDETKDLKGRQLMAVRCLHSVVGMMGELGEICTILQKWIWYGKGDPDINHLEEEYGDALWYHAEGLNALKLNLQLLMQRNLAKLRARYPEKYSDWQAAEENRDRDKEAAAMKEINDMLAGPGNIQGLAPVEKIMAPSFPITKVHGSQDEGLKEVLGYEHRKKAIESKQAHQDGHGFGHQDEKEGDSHG